MQDHQHLCQEMLMEHICIVKWADHLIVWPSVHCHVFWYHLWNKVVHWHQGYKLYQCSVYSEGWWSLGIYGLARPWLCPPSGQASHLGYPTTRFLSLLLHMHLGLYTCYKQELVADKDIKIVLKSLHLVLLKGDNWLLPLQWLAVLSL